VNKFVGFDLEIYEEIDDVADWKENMPLGVTCASTVSSDGRMETCPLASPVHQQYPAMGEWTHGSLKEPRESLFLEP
jgi:hypothetical protein